MKISENLGISGTNVEFHHVIWGFQKFSAGNRKVVVGNPTLRVASTDDSRQPRVNSFGKKTFIVLYIECRKRSFIVYSMSNYVSKPNQKRI